MVNKEAFAKRLQELMDYYEISAASLADKIGVQRSSISHLLSGRNNPSLDFVIKILDNFPGISYDWLVKGIGTLDSSVVDLDENQHSPTLFDLSSDANTPLKHLESKDLKATQDKSIAKILLLYADGSFEAFDKHS